MTLKLQTFCRGVSDRLYHKGLDRSVMRQREYPTYAVGPGAVNTILVERMGWTGRNTTERQRRVLSMITLQPKGAVIFHG